MEHARILGLGEPKWLAFARSRIRALRALGLEYASQTYNLGGSLVRVRIVGEHEYITITGAGGYWLYVRSQEAKSVTAPGSATRTIEERAYLFKMPADLKTANAKLYATGGRKLTSVASIAGTTLSGVTNSEVFTGTQGLPTAFIPYGDKALVIYSSGYEDFAGTQNMTTGAVTAGSQRTSHFKTKLVWTADGDQVYDYDFTTTLTYPSSTSNVGATPRNVPIMLANGEIDFIEWDGSTNTNKRIVLGASEGPVADPDGIAPVSPLIARPGTPYTRREVGSAQQDRASIWIYAPFSPTTHDDLFTREMALKTNSPYADGLAVFLTNARLAKARNTTPIIDIVDYLGTVKASIDIRDLPNLTSDSFFTTTILNSVSENTGGDVTAQNVFGAGIQTYHNDFTGLRASSLNYPDALTGDLTGFQWRSPASPAVPTQNILAAIVPDQPSLWS